LVIIIVTAQAFQLKQQKKISDFTLQNHEFHRELTVSDVIMDTGHPGIGASV
jgi:hypothetical protein